MKKKRWAKTRPTETPQWGKCEECGKDFIWGNGAMVIYLSGGDEGKYYDICSNDCVAKTSARLKRMEQIWDAL